MRIPTPEYARVEVVTPAMAIATSSVAAASVIATTLPHGFVSGDTVAIAGHVGSTPSLDGSRVVTVLTPTTFSVPVTVTVAGTSGTATRTTPVEPLTLAQGKLRAGLDWLDGDARDALMTDWIRTARSTVEKRVSRALLLQTLDVYYDAIRGRVLTLPRVCRPLQRVVSISSIDSAGATQVLDDENYVVDLVGGRIGLADSGDWPTDLRQFQPWVIRVQAGDLTIAQIPAPLVHAVGLLTAHYATAGRDIVRVGNIVAEMPEGFEDVIAPYVPASVV